MENIKEKLIKYIESKKNKILKLNEVYEILKLQYIPENDRKILNLLEELEKQGYISSLKTAKKNYVGSFEKYRILNVKKEEEDIKEKILKLNKKIKIDYYLGHVEEYKKDEEIVLGINRFLEGFDRKTELTVNERSYEIFRNEKILKENENILKKLGLKFCDLNCYDTYEPFFYYINNKNKANENRNYKTNFRKNILVIENKDTFWTIVRAIQNLKKDDIYLIIYGEGKKILKSFSYIEEFEIDEKDKIYYFGDIDFEGVNIYITLKERFKNYNIEVFKKGYETILDIEEKPENIRKSQNENKEKIEKFLEEFDEKYKEELENIKFVFETNNSKKQQLEGQINMLIENLLKQKGETYLEENRIKEINLIESKIEENKLKLNLNKKEIKELSLKVGKVNEDVKNLEKECDLLETYIKENEIEEFFVDTSDILQNEILSYKKITTERKNERKIIDKLINEFIQKINFIKDSVDNFFIKQDVLEELQNIIIPSKLADANIVDNGITTIIETLEEKIRHIDEALEILESYQENFITKCFEKAENIVRDLEKLPGLSRIKISGKDTNIIKLDLYEYEKDEKISRMKEYIYGLVKEMEENPDKMTKEYLNESLSSKALVAKIVNMDKASVKLFKIEDIKENSTYKKWEDDLGSDGQVNAIYFMFAVCIISYISMLTRKESSNKSKKVIIADNPFGATSAVFLWDTMFAILKENNVQLIAPGHNINKEIVSKFEVNYVLKHEYFNGNKKSVVVDKELRTEDDIDNMSFDVIEGDQQSMF